MSERGSPNSIDRTNLPTICASVTVSPSGLMVTTLSSVSSIVSLYRSTWGGHALSKQPMGIRQLARGIARSPGSRRDINPASSLCSATAVPIAFCVPLNLCGGAWLLDGTAQSLRTLSRESENALPRKWEVSPRLHTHRAWHHDCRVVGTGCGGKQCEGGPQLCYLQAT